MASNGQWYPEKGWRRKESENLVFVLPSKHNCLSIVNTSIRNLTSQSASISPLNILPREQSSPHTLLSLSNKYVCYESIVQQHILLLKLQELVRVRCCAKTIDFEIETT